eukprot:NODE_506_length_7505_cov_0.263705.p2 type:complete len:284 gc:universal NODE_506_length_7505_cov_0.263705:1468-2319(+)
MYGFFTNFAETHYKKAVPDTKPISSIQKNTLSTNKLDIDCSDSGSNSKNRGVSLIKYSKRSPDDSNFAFENQKKTKHRNDLEMDIRRSKIPSVEENNTSDINRLLQITLDFSERFGNGFDQNYISGKVYIDRDHEKVKMWKLQISRLKQKLTSLKSKKVRNDADILKLTNKLSMLERQAFSHHLGVLYSAYRSNCSGNPDLSPSNHLQNIPDGRDSNDSYYKDQVYTMNAKVNSAFSKVNSLEDQLLSQTMILKKLYSNLPSEHKNGSFTVRSFEAAINSIIK